MADLIGYNVIGDTIFLVVHLIAPLILNWGQNLQSKQSGSAGYEMALFWQSSIDHYGQYNWEVITAMPQDMWSFQGTLLSLSHIKRLCIHYVLQ